ncbi:MAG: phosphoribosylanthranilate isomerase [Victivallaceae bacterium]|nr:phosphoribosylanthranilate isomerase [Victivallaceae bacterium]
MRTFEIKICGLTRRNDVELAARLGADFVGFVLAPGSPRRVAVDRLPELSKPCGPRRVGVFKNATISEIMSHVEYLDIIQLHGSEPPEFAAAIARVTGLEVWKAAVIRQVDDIAGLAAFPAARLVIDSPGGGTGQLCDWHLARLAAERFPVMLAGGVAPDNIQAAIREVNPAGLDISSRLETSPGIKSEKMMKKLFEEIVQ